MSDDMQLSIGFNEDLLNDWLDAEGMNGALAGLEFEAQSIASESKPLSASVYRDTGEKVLVSLSALNLWSAQDVERLTAQNAALHLLRRSDGNAQVVNTLLSAWVSRHLQKVEDPDDYARHLVHHVLSNKYHEQDPPIHLDVPGDEVFSVDLIEGGVELSKNSEMEIEFEAKPDFSTSPDLDVKPGVDTQSGEIKRGAENAGDVENKTQRPSQPTKEDPDKYKTDMGAFVWGARKDKVIIADLIRDIHSDEDAIKARGVINRNKLWKKPDYEALSSEVGKKAAYFVSKAYQMIRPAPKFTSLRDLEDFVSVTEMTKQICEDKEIVNSDSYMMDMISKLSQALNNNEEVKDSFVRGSLASIVTPTYQKILRSPIQCERLFKASAEKSILDGWPRKLPAWHKGFEIVPKGVGFAARDMKKDLLSKAFETVDDVEEYLQNRFCKKSLLVNRDPVYSQEFAIMKQLKSGDLKYLKGGFETEKEAISYMNDNVIELHDQKPFKITRNGLRDIWREGDPIEDVTMEQFKERFGFKALQFGLSVAKDERLDHVNKANAAFADLAQTLGLPDRAMSLGGELSLAFGSRGKGGYLAHYEGGSKKIINITREKGAGAMCHEWFHALDNYLTSDSNENPWDGFASRSGCERSDAVSDKLKELVSCVKTKAATEKNYISILSKMYDAKERAAKKVTLSTKWCLYNMDKCDATDPVIDARESAAQWIDELHNKIKNRDLDDIEIGDQEIGKETVLLDPEIEKKLEDNGLYLGARELLRVRQRLVGVVKELKSIDAKFDNVKPEDYEGLTVQTDFYGTAAAMDAGRKNKYWSATIELAARAFERYVCTKIEEKGNFNDYLVNGVKSLGMYPFGDENKSICKKFDELMVEVGNGVKNELIPMVYDGHVSKEIIDVKEVITSAAAAAIEEKKAKPKSSFKP